MSSAFKNFFITFAVCLLIFSFLGFQYGYPWLNEVFDLTNMGEKFKETSSEEVSQEEEVSVPPKTENPNYNPDGDVFTAIIMAVDSNGRAVNTVFIDSNGKTKQYIYCKINNNVKGINDVGVTGPVSELFANMTPEAICKSVSAMTGIETKYCLRFERKDLSAIAAVIPGAYVVLNEDVMFVNPKYKNLDITNLPEGERIPDDYYLTISNVDGKVLLNEKIAGKTKLEWLLEFNPNFDGSDYNSLYNSISKSLLEQFLNNESSTMSTEVMTKVLSNCDTNMSVDNATSHLATIFSHNDYTRHNLNLPANWEDAVEKLRGLDGSYE